MVFNSGKTMKFNGEIAHSSLGEPVQKTFSYSKHLPLNAPMIDRIHKAKPGCSACGKKVS